MSFTYVLPGYYDTCWRSSTFLRCFACLAQSLIKNKIEGVTKGYLIYLKIVGIGYRASVEGQTITFKVGFAHDVAYDLPPSMRAFAPEPTLVGIYGIDKNQVWQTYHIFTRVAADSLHHKYPDALRASRHIRGRRGLIGAGAACLLVHRDFCRKHQARRHMSEVWRVSEANVACR